MLKSLLTSPALQPIIMGQLRHYVTIAGASLATQGFMGGSDVETFTGAVMALAALIWSAVSKKVA